MATTKGKTKRMFCNKCRCETRFQGAGYGFRAGVRIQKYQCVSCGHVQRNGVVKPDVAKDKKDRTNQEVTQPNSE